MSTPSTQAQLERQGWAHLSGFQLSDDDGAALLGIARSLGEVAMPPGRPEGSPFVHTQAALEASPWEPYNRLEALGWHDDFATTELRARFSLIWVRAVPGPGGAWRVVDGDAVIGALEHRSEGRRALELLSSTKLPYCYAPGTPVRWFRALDGADAPLLGRWRFDARAIHAGLDQHEVSGARQAVATVCAAADALQTRIEGQPGDLLVCRNGRAFHDRLPQAEGRRAMLVFVS